MSYDVDGTTSIYPPDSVFFSMLLHTKKVFFVCLGNFSKVQTYDFFRMFEKIVTYEKIVGLGLYKESLFLTTGLVPKCIILKVNLKNICIIPQNFRLRRTDDQWLA